MDPGVSALGRLAVSDLTTFACTLSSLRFPYAALINFSNHLLRRFTIAQPIYKLFLFRNIEAYDQLSPDERNELLDKINAAFEKVGGKRVIVCNSS
jgi:hypothetical protein